jgi:hypothetical protein
MKTIDLVQIDLPMDLVETSCSSETSGDEVIPLDNTVRRKIDLRLIPLITILYLCCFLYVHLPPFYEYVALISWLKGIEAIWVCPFHI